MSHDLCASDSSISIIHRSSICEASFCFLPHFNSTVDFFLPFVYLSISGSLLGRVCFDLTLSDMENQKESCGGEKPAEENSIPVEEPETLQGSDSPSRIRSSRTPFTSLSQVDADLALARTLQEQERAYMMLSMPGGDGSEFGSSESDSFVCEDHVGDPGEDETANVVSDGEEDAFDVHARAADEDGLIVDIDPSAFNSDEAYARALQDAEDREVAVRMMALAGIHEWEADDQEDHGSDTQDMWQEVDPEELSYEELLALGDVVGTESRGLSADTIASLPSTYYKAKGATDTDQCVICRVDYEEDDSLKVLLCKHAYHSDCINNWLQINKVCPVCSAEVSPSEGRQTASGIRKG